MSIVKNSFCLLAGIALMLIFSVRVSAQTPSYEGKVIRIVVGSTAGGGFDAYSRAIARQLIKIGMQDPGAYSQPYLLPPGTPKEHVAMHRRAFLNTMKDPEFLAEANKSKMDIEPVPGEEIEEMIAGLFKQKPQIITRLKEILK